MKAPRPLVLPIALLAMGLSACDKAPPTTADNGLPTGHYPPNTTQAGTPNFIRFVDSEAKKGEGRLETAITTYEGRNGEKVELIGAVHIADGVYFERLVELFTGYESLLYELIKPEGAAPPSPGRGNKAPPGLNPIVLLQRAMQGGLGLAYQIDGIDYTADNFVHADLDAETFNTLSAERGQRLSQLFLRAMLDEFANNLKGKSNAKVDPLLEFKILGALFSKDRSKRMKYLFAQQLSNAENMLESFGEGFGDGESVILIERNKKAIEVLRERLAAGEKNIGIFYGAAHLADLEERIFAEIGLTRIATRWETAWLIE